MRCSCVDDSDDFRRARDAVVDDPGFFASSTISSVLTPGKCALIARTAGVELGVVPQQVAALDRVADLDLRVEVDRQSADEQRDAAAVTLAGVTERQARDAGEQPFLQQVNAGFLGFAADDLLDVLRRRQVRQQHRDQQDAGGNDPQRPEAAEDARGSSIVVIGAMAMKTMPKMSVMMPRMDGAIMTPS